MRKIKKLFDISDKEDSISSEYQIEYFDEKVIEKFYIDRDEGYIYEVEKEDNMFHTLFYIKQLANLLDKNARKKWIYACLSHHYSYYLSTFNFLIRPFIKRRFFDIILNDVHSELTEISAKSYSLTWVIRYRPGKAF
jgi:hypothetical protein